MRFAARVVATVAVVALALTTAGRATGADTQAVVAQIEAHNKAFLAAYENGELKRMKAEIKAAISLGEKNKLTSEPVMADTYVLAAILEIDGNDNAAGGVKYFQKALKVKPDVAIPKGMATSPVKLALKQARGDTGEAPKEGATAAAAAPAAEPAKPAEETDKTEKTDKTDKAAPKEAEKTEKTDKQKAAEEAARQKDEKAEKARADGEAKQKEKQEKEERAEQERQDKATKAERQKAEKAEAAQQKEKAVQDKQLADAKTRSQQLEKERADRDKQLADVKARGLQLEKERADRDKQLADRDKQLADAKARIQQLEREKGDKDKQLADAKGREVKEREAREKVEREHQLAEAKEREAEAKKKQDQENRERLFAGPAMPAYISEAVHCEVPDEAPLRTDLFVHCVAKPSLKARSIVFYYRTGSSHYYSVPMERTAKGWYAAIVPAMRVVGKSMQYYAEALNEREAIVGRNGKDSSPNILTLKPSVPRG